jgi:hypothetical protein
LWAAKAETVEIQVKLNYLHVLDKKADALGAHMRRIR